MADENEDQWLYGDGDGEPNESRPEAEPEPEPEQFDDETNGLLAPPGVLENGDNVEFENSLPPTVDDQLDASASDKPPEDYAVDDTLQPPGDEPPETDPINEKPESDEDDDDDSEDDDVNVVIGDMTKASGTYSSGLIKRGLVAAPDKNKPQPGKFNVDEFEGVGTINGVPAHEYNLDSIDDKPWRKPGADITDYFNYGFNEDTWRAYCERQKRIRIADSGQGLRKIGTAAPTTRGSAGPIAVIGGGLASRRAGDAKPVTKENTIQVMTADRREYSRKGMMGENVEQRAFENADGFFTFEDPYYQNFEPTQEQQWGADNHVNGNWPNGPPNSAADGMPGMAPSNLPNPMVMIPPPNMPMDAMNKGMMIPPPNMMPPMGPMPPNMMPNQMMGMSASERERYEHDMRRVMSKDSPSRDRDYSRDHSRARVDRERHRERTHTSHRRERSRSRSKRHRSRSRSASRRSAGHKKKKSKRHDKSDSE